MRRRTRLAVTLCAVLALAAVLWQARGDPTRSGPSGTSAAISPESVDTPRAVELHPVRRTGHEIRSAGEEPTLFRSDVYRSIAQQSDFEVGRRIARSLLAVLGVAGERARSPVSSDDSVDPLGSIEADLAAAIEADDLHLLAGAAFVLAEASRGPNAPLGHDRLLGWIGVIAASESAAAAILMIFETAGAFSDEHLQELFRTVRAGLPEDQREEAARRLAQLHVMAHEDPAPFLPLLEDPVRLLREIAVDCLARIDAELFADRILDAATRRDDPERSTLVFRLTSQLPAERAAELLQGLEARWPEGRVATPWVDVGHRDNEVLVKTFRSEPSGRIRRKILMGWSGKNCDPAEAERFLTEVLDTDPDPAVRAQALLALGQTDHPRARQRLEEATRTEGDRTWEGHLSAAIRNALDAAPDDWVHRVALPYARRRIAGSAFPDEERQKWIRRLRSTHPDAVEALGGP